MKQHLKGFHVIIHFMPSKGSKIQFSVLSTKYLSLDVRLFPNYGYADPPLLPSEVAIST